ncbi:MAG: tetratricopeptide (TPR) repeat protein [Planctomycetota bacterium]|jgi:tetratricopeptide (TPR) repeat protein
MQEYKDRKPSAIRFFEAAYRFQMEGDLDGADELYSKSIALYPTAEAYTFSGWCRSFRQEWDEAIALCECAIEIDPEYGNPYNDIGAYMIQQGLIEESIPWLEKALKAERYACPFFAFYNLGQVFEEMGDLESAEDYYRCALEENPEYTLARVSLSRVVASRE